ncbi:MAG: class I SAM-dependent RNA methyltransferase [Clostridiales bacterium]|nr:class I SAM-dependent RNA methyltransferase [Clostridiales bacterium]
MKLTAVCIFGIESVLAREIRELGLEVDSVNNGRVEFSGGVEAIAKSNLWLRTAERIYIKVADFPAYTFDELFNGTKQINWQEFIKKDGKINVRSSSINSKLFSQRDCQRIVKKAITEKLGEIFKIQQLPETGSEYKIEIFIHNNTAEINIDTTGTGLHKRGYRTLNVEAPLKETIAAALLKISYWNPKRILLDPFCGSGTFPIEAAMMSANIAPGINRDFLFETWSYENKKILDKEKSIAKKSIKSIEEILILGSDISYSNIKIAKKHAFAAGVEHMIDFKTADALSLDTPGVYGVMICNPPYGLRISDKEDVLNLYKGLGKQFEKFDTWSKYVLTDSAVFEKIAGIKANKRRKIYNGTISCTFYQYFGPKPL